MINNSNNWVLCVCVFSSISACVCVFLFLVLKGFHTAPAIPAAQERIHLIYSSSFFFSFKCPSLSAPSSSSSCWLPPLHLFPFDDFPPPPPHLVDWLLILPFGSHFELGRSNQFKFKSTLHGPASIICIALRNALPPLPPSPHEKLFNAFHISFPLFRWRCHTIPTHTGRKRTAYKSKDRRNPLIFKYTKHTYLGMDGWINGWMDGMPDMMRIVCAPAG